MRMRAPQAFGRASPLRGVILLGRGVMAPKMTCGYGGCPPQYEYISQVWRHERVRFGVLKRAGRSTNVGKPK